MLRSRASLYPSEGSCRSWRDLTWLASSYFRSFLATTTTIEQWSLDFMLSPPTLNGSPLADSPPVVRVIHDGPPYSSSTTSTTHLLLFNCRVSSLSYKIYRRNRPPGTLHTQGMTLTHTKRKSKWVVTPIGPVLTTATTVKLFDRPKRPWPFNCIDFTALTRLWVTPSNTLTVD